MSIIIGHLRWCAINTTANNADFTLATIVHDGTDPNNPIPVNFQPGLEWSTNNTNYNCRYLDL